MKSRVDVQQKVSVVVPTYGRPRMLARALQSVDAQTHRNIEVVVVDDNGIGTPQQLATQHIIESLRMRDGITLRYVVRTQNGGGSVARNTGIDEASCDYVAFLDDDDEWMPEKIERQIGPLLEDDAVAMTYAHCRAIREGTEDVFYRRTVNGNALFEQALCGCIAATSQWLCRKEALLRVGSFSDSPSKQDSILLYKLLLAGYKIRCVPEVLSMYNDQSHGRISTSGRSLEGEHNYSMLIRDNYERFTVGQRRQVEGAILYRLGRLHWLGGNKVSGAVTLCASLILSPVSFVKRVRHVDADRLG